MIGAVVVASNRAAAGVYEDTAGPLIVAALRELGFEVPGPMVVPDGEQVGEAIAAGGLDFTADVSDEAGNHPDARRIVHDLIEEYGRHVGHADLIRESIDGATGA